MSGEVAKTAVVLLAFGTPRQPSAPAVAAYLAQMLTDRHVLNLPWPLRMLLGGLLIPLLRARRSAAAYRSIWTEEGSPLQVHTQKLATALQARLAGADGESEYRVWAAMRLGQPSIPHILGQVRHWRPQKVVLLPLYPQYAASTTGTAQQLALRQLARWPLQPQIEVCGEYADAPGFVEAVAAPALASTKPDSAQMQLKKGEAVLFSFHGLPVSHLRQTCKAGGAEHCPCAAKTEPASPFARDRYCYRAGCWATARALAKRLNLTEGQWHLGFQSRLGKGWLLPHTDQLAVQLAAKGVRRLVVFCPSFTADCLETLEEIGIALAKDFRAAGGEELSLLPCPNASPPWVEFLAAFATGQYRE